MPKNFFPAVEKGIAEGVLTGPLAGYPVVGVKAVLYDGSYHPVDSSDSVMYNASNSTLLPTGLMTMQYSPRGSSSENF